MKIKYSIGVKVPAGWRSVTVIAVAEKISAAMVQVKEILTIDGEKPSYGQSRTGAKRQEFNGMYWANAETGKKKRLSACEILE